MKELILNNCIHISLVANQSQSEIVNLMTGIGKANANYAQVKIHNNKSFMLWHDTNIRAPYSFLPYNKPITLIELKDIEEVNKLLNKQFENLESLCTLIFLVNPPEGKIIHQDKVRTIQTENFATKEDLFRHIYDSVEKDFGILSVKQDEQPSSDSMLRKTI